MVELLFAQPPELDAEALAAAVRETLPGTVAVDGEQVILAHEDYPQELEDGTKPLLTVVMRPGEDAGAGPYDLSQSWAFEEKEAAAERAATTLLVAEMLGRGRAAAGPRDRLQGHAGGGRGADGAAGDLVGRRR